MESKARRTVTLDARRTLGALSDFVASRGDGRIYKRKGSSRYWMQYSILGTSIASLAARRRLQPGRSSGNDSAKPAPSGLAGPRPSA